MCHKGRSSRRGFGPARGGFEPGRGACGGPGLRRLFGFIAAKRAARRDHWYGNVVYENLSGHNQFGMQGQVYGRPRGYEYGNKGVGDVKEYEYRRREDQQQQGFSQGGQVAWGDGKEKGGYERCEQEKQWQQQQLLREAQRNAKRVGQSQNGGVWFDFERSGNLDVTPPRYSTVVRN